MTRPRTNYFEVIETILANSFGDRQAATDATYALAEAGVIGLLYAAHEGLEKLDTAVGTLADRTYGRPDWTNAFGDPASVVAGEAARV